MSSLLCFLDWSWLNRLKNFYNSKKPHWLFKYVLTDKFHCYPNHSSDVGAHVQRCATPQTHQAWSATCFWTSCWTYNGILCFWQVRSFILFSCKYGCTFENTELEVLQGVHTRESQGIIFWSDKGKNYGKSGKFNPMIDLRGVFNYIFNLVVLTPTIKAFFQKCTAV